MFIMVSDIMKKSYDMWKTNMKIGDCVNELDQYIERISKLLEITANPKSATTVGAKAKRARLKNDAFIIKEALRLYYDYNNMEEEMNLYSFKKSHFDRLRINDFYLLVFEISEKASALSEELEEFRISGQQISELGQEVDTYYKLIQTKEKLNETYKGATADTAALIDNCRLMLRNRLDRMMNIYSESNRTEYLWYTNVRKIHHKGGPKNYYTVIVNGKIYESKSRVPLNGASVVPETKGKSAVSDEKGKFVVKIYKKHAKLLNFALDGYEPAIYVFPDEVKEHKMTVSITMKKKAGTDGTD
jgi:hypothetical protein